MFLMNTPPLVALQRTWEPFVPSRNCRYPICFSESEDDIARTAVSAKVQVIINNLQSEEASLDASCSEYGCLMQKKQKGTKVRSPKLRASGRTLQKHIEYTQSHSPADSDGMEVEESSEFGPLLLNSDSDDSVDRDIEEAIQEYLKNKGQCISPLPSEAKNLHSVDNAACSLFPTDGKLNEVQCPCSRNYFEGDTASSPCSVSSNDSFEQSIEAEIEQFLNEKKQQSRKKDITLGHSKLHQKETVRNRKESGRRYLKQERGKALFLRHHLELGGTNAPSKQESKTNGEELGDFSTTGQAPLKTPLAGHSCILEQSRKGKKRQALWKAREKQTLQSIDISDSSSDDGIEEAIQLYQLEKTRKAADSKAGHAPFPKEEFGAIRIKDISARLMIRSVKGALPEIPRKALSRKGRQNCSKAAELNKFHTICSKTAEKGNVGHTLEDGFAKCALTFQASCRTDTAAELMCAEAILDISKTILPLPTGSSNSRSFATSDPSFCSQSVPPFQIESDSDSVNSDDSIEQEIRTFLAVKAQAGGLVAKNEGVSHIAQISPFSGQPLKLSPSQKRKPKAGSKQGQSTQLVLSDMPQGEGGLSILKNNKVGGAVASCQQDAVTIASLIDFGNPLSQGQLGARELFKSMAWGQQKYIIEDKSSSFDSDEDLDTAIKDLLRSKRKLKKKPKDQRILCKKRVRFSETEMQILGDKKTDYKPKAPSLLKSCLMSPGINFGEEDAKKGLRSIMKSQSVKATECVLEFKKECHTKSVAGPKTWDGAKSNQCLWAATSLTDNSSSMDSDDSIEQEIQRFLAEKAKDSTEVPRADGIVETLQIDKPQTAVSKAKHQLFRDGGNTLLEWSKKAKKAGPLMIVLRSSLKAEEETMQNVSHCDMQVVSSEWDLCSQGTVQTKRSGLPAKHAVVQRKVGYDSKLDQRNIPPGKGKSENFKSQNYFKSLSSFKRKSPYEFKVSSKFIAGLRSTQNKKKPVLVGKGQGEELSFKRQGGVPVSDLLGKRRMVRLQRERVLRSRCQAGFKEADLSSGGACPFLTERQGETEEVYLCNEAVNLADIKPLEPCCRRDSSHGFPLHVPSTTNDQGVRVTVAQCPAMLSSLMG
ncbi:protein phosphatase 1 regulatory subunit 26 [Zootoca vivipara]|uniref:protein phosphatase 1 regulatory subunit 26 n=1 Tax=Zootoca vivipara TaxID=8524 RepID=UPI0015916E98|nr:protein phosphatase 1 regulatory subunit 26 [Zootoca vivipara]XP_034969596.1 protein phosphatase 1 regulatory subunit 26 [Zootoca vivipara]XP_034969597.1 protein phosphatase 1 regulatory subunit 26 [Zootoca vivipara]